MFKFLGTDRDLPKVRAPSRNPQYRANTIGSAALLIALFALFCSVGAVYVSFIQSETMREQSRAYVDNRATMLVGTASTGRLYFQSYFKDYGQTPARNFTYSWGSNLDTPPPGNIFTTKPIRYHARGTQTIFPTEESKWRDSVDVGPDLSEILTKGKTVSFYGILHYEDEFDRQHSTHFCFFFDREDLLNQERTRASVYGQKCNNDNTAD